MGCSSKDSVLIVIFPLSEYFDGISIPYFAIFVNNYQLLIIQSEKMKIIFNDTCNSIEKNNEFIECLKNLNDISKTAEVNKINLKTREIEKYYVLNLTSYRYL